MFQKRYTIEFSDSEKQLSEMIYDIKENPCFKNKKYALLQLYTGNMPSKDAITFVEFFSEQLPDIPVVAESFFGFDSYHSIDGFVANLVYSGEAGINAYFIDAKDKDQDTILKTTEDILSKTEAVKYVQLAPAGSEFSHALFISSLAGDYPDVFFGGAGAGFHVSDISYNEFSEEANAKHENSFIDEDPGADIGLPWESYLIIDGKIEHDGVLMVVFSGKSLLVDARCILGWKPIGKEMEITSARLHGHQIGDTEVFTIDGMPATEIYNKYLGVEPNKYFVTNVCEFPAILEKNGMLQARVPFMFSEDGGLIFNGDMQKGDKIRLSYANPANLILECKTAAKEQAEMSPEATFLFICGNRTNLLKEGAIKQIRIFEKNSPDLSVGYGHYEIYAKGDQGGVLNSVLISVAMREGEADAKPPACTNQVICDDLPNHHGEENIPLWFRMMRFLEATTGELQEAVVAAQEASRAKSNFLSSMSHEIRTPINAILGMNEMILRENNDKNIAEYAENIEAAGKSLLGLINDILDFSKIEAGRMEILPVEYELSSVLNDLVNMIRARAEDKGLILEISCDRDIPHILLGDEIRIKQVVTNILTNAVKYTNEGTVTMTIGYEKRSESEIGLKISVEDTGIGMKPEEIGKLYDDYARLDEKRNRTVEGTGLGMGITRQLLELMGSKMEVSSVYGEGSKFEFVLPQKVINWEGIGDFEEAVRKYASERKKYRRKFHAPQARILAVDDTKMNLSVITGLLKQTDVVIDTAESGFECLAYTQQTPYDIIFLDHRMPGMDGIEAFHRIREQNLSPNSDTPVIALTANAVSGAREEYFREGFTDYLSKPIDPEKLEEMMIKYLPSEKVLIDDEPESKNETSESGMSLPQPILDIGELSIDDGLLYCGGAEGYIQALTIFSESAADNAAYIKELFDGKQWEDYTTKVHALKSSARVIGASSLSEEARELESAGNEGDIQKITDNTPGLLERYISLGKALKDALGVNTSNETLPEISSEELEESYEAIREFAQGYDMDSIGFVLNTLKEYKIPDDAADRHKKLMEAIKAADWDRIKLILA